MSSGADGIHISSAYCSVYSQRSYHEQQTANESLAQSTLRPSTVPCTMKYQPDHARTTYTHIHTHTQAASQRGALSGREYRPVRQMIKKAMLTIYFIGSLHSSLEWSCSHSVLCSEKYNTITDPRSL